MRFYNTRDTSPRDWYPLVDGIVEKFDDLPPEYRGNVNVTEAPYNRTEGATPALTDEEVDLIVEFLDALDGYRP